MNDKKPADHVASDDERNPLTPPRIVGIFAICIVGFFLGAAFTIIYFENGVATVESGSASIGSLFSALAFAGVIITIMLQSYELKLQRKELRETKEQLAKSAEAQTESQKALRQQAESAALAGYLNAVVALLSQPLENSRDRLVWQTAVIKTMDHLSTRVKSVAGVDLKTTLAEAVVNRLEQAEHEFYTIVESSSDLHRSQTALSDLYASLQQINALIPPASMDAYDKQWTTFMSRANERERKTCEDIREFAKVVRTQFEAMKFFVRDLSG